MTLETTAGQRRGERLLGADDVVVEPADERAGLGAGEERDRHPLHVVEHLGAQVVDQALADARGEPALDQAEHARRRSRARRPASASQMTTCAVRPCATPSSMIDREQQRVARPRGPRR